MLVHNAHIYHVQQCSSYHTYIQSFHNHSLVLQYTFCTAQKWKKSFTNPKLRAAALSLFHTYCLFAWKFSIRYRFTIHFLCSQVVGYILFVDITYKPQHAAIVSLVSVYISIQQLHIAAGCALGISRLTKHDVYLPIYSYRTLSHRFVY